MLEFSAEHTETAIARIVTECAERRIPVPAFILNRPQLDVGEVFYHSSYAELSTARPQSYTEQPIPLPWYEIVRYANWLGLNDAEQMSFVSIMRAVDTWYCAGTPVVTDEDNG